MIQDIDNGVYIGGNKMHYTPHKLAFNPEVLDINEIRMMACGRKHYVVVNNENNLFVWGSLFKDSFRSDAQTEGFWQFYGDSLFDEGKIKNLEIKYSIFGALIEH